MESDPKRREDLDLRHEHDCRAQRRKPCECGRRAYVERAEEAIRDKSKVRREKESGTMRICEHWILMGMHSDVFSEAQEAGCILHEICSRIYDRSQKETEASLNYDK